MIGNGILSSAFIRGTVHNMQNMILNMANDFIDDKIFSNCLEVTLRLRYRYQYIDVFQNIVIF